LTHLAVRYECRRHQVPILFNGCWNERSILWQFSLPAFLSSVIIVPVGWYCNALLVRQPGGMGAMGQYAVAATFSTLIATVTSFLGAPLAPMLANRPHSTNNNLQFINLYITFGIASVLCIGVLVFPEVLTFIYGSSFSGESFLLTTTLLTLSTWMATFKLSLNRVAVATETMWSTLGGDALRGVTFLAITFLLVPRYGIIGLALAGFAGILLTTLYLVILLSKTGKLSCSLFLNRCFGETIFIVILSSLVGLLLSSIVMKISFIIVAMCYTIWIFKTAFAKL